MMIENFGISKLLKYSEDFIKHPDPEVGYQGVVFP
jgi:hypothetical protein